MVPADAEVVIEGVIRPGARDAEGPFGEYSQYLGEQRINPVMEVTCITCRQDAYWHATHPGHPDNVVLGAVSAEGAMYSALKKLFPTVQKIYVPNSGAGRHHAYITVKKVRPGMGKDVILVALGSYYMMKHVFVFDDDVDIFDETEVLRALAMRFQIDKDLVCISGGACATNLDPSSPPSLLGGKGGFDCTVPLPPRPGWPPLFAFRSRIPDEVMKKVKIENYVSEDRISRIPTEPY